MKVVIAGSRNITTFSVVELAINASGFREEITEVVHGGARGVDTTAEKWARLRKLPTKKFPADWDTHGLAAGAIRNRQMAEYADALIAVWDGRSRGTLMMINFAHDKKLPTYVKTLRWEKDEW